jgi:glycosyltransferase involved in cell wall biosynthesis
MHIGISTSVIQRGQTGVAQHLFALLRAFLHCPNEHRFTLFVLEKDLPLFDWARDRMQLYPVPERARPPVKNILWHQFALPALVRRLSVDVLHIPSYRRMLWPRPRPQVATIHDLAPFRVPHKYDWKRMFYGRIVARRLAQRQDAIITVSENTARDLATFFKVPAEKITVIYNGLAHDRFFPGDPRQAKAKLARSCGLSQPFFLYTARLEHPGKNHVSLITAFEQFKTATRSNWQLAFAGSDWHGAEFIHAAIDRSAVAPDIRCLGFVPDENLPELYRAADTFIYPSLYEGFGMPPLEAMACGCPVISSARGSLAEVIGDAAVIIDPENVASIGEQLSAVATNPALRERLRGAGLTRAQQFNWDTAAVQTLKVYEKVARSVNLPRRCSFISKTAAMARPS